jgi:hypothetical protein
VIHELPGRERIHALTDGHEIRRAEQEERRRSAGRGLLPGRPSPRQQCDDHEQQRASRELEGRGPTGGCRFVAARREVQGEAVRRSRDPPRGEERRSGGHEQEHRHEAAPAPRGRGPAAHPGLGPDRRQDRHAQRRRPEELLRVAHEPEARQAQEQGVDGGVPAECGHDQEEGARSRGRRQERAQREAERSEGEGHEADVEAREERLAALEERLSRGLRQREIRREAWHQEVEERPGVQRPVGVRAGVQHGPVAVAGALRRGKPLHGAKG